ncbi:MAG: PIN domain-containing protein [Planctomycetota bacterium]
MNILVDTSVWSLALRRDNTSDSRHVRRLQAALEHSEQLFTTGLILQELLQGFAGARNRQAILAQFESLPLIAPDRGDHVDAADLRSAARRRGIQIGTIDALLAQLAIRHELALLTADQDFARLAKVAPLQLLSLD